MSDRWGRVAHIWRGSITLETIIQFSSEGAPCLPAFGKRGISLEVQFFPTLIDETVVVETRKSFLNEGRVAHISRPVWGVRGMKGCPISRVLCEKWGLSDRGGYFSRRSSEKSKCRKLRKNWSALADDFRTFLLHPDIFEPAFSAV